MKFPSIAKLNSPEKFRDRTSQLGIEIPFQTETEGQGPLSLATSLKWQGGTIGNRFCILPMEGWDGTLSGQPTELTKRRWRNFGLSGAKLIWGGEAVAVRHDGRANPNQLLINDTNLSGLETLRTTLVSEHQSRFEKVDDLVVGLQLTHSGRFARPNSKTQLEPRTAYRHPYLDKKFSVDPQTAILTDEELKRLIDDFVAAAKLAAKAGFQFVDIKHCHGYLGHELLSAYDRPGEFGGSFENRTRFLVDVTKGIQAESPALKIGIRLSVFDFCPFESNEQVGVPVATPPYTCGFGGDKSGTGMDLEEPNRFAELLVKLGIELVCTTAGSPYYNPHIQRPAAFPPSDGYQPPEDPLVGVARQLEATRQLKSMHPDLILVGSGYSYLQDWLPNVARAAIARNWVDSVGIGRMVLSYHDLPADVLEGKPMSRKRVCRTFSDCTTAPRKGLVSGCYPLDPFYKSRPEFEKLREHKFANKHKPNP